MRLIDANKIRYSDLSDGKVPDGLWCTWKERIDAMPTVNAIPIEWIKEWRKHKWLSNKPIEERIVMAMGVRLMLEDWEKENERL